MSKKGESGQRELNPHFRHGKAAGYRYIMAAKETESGGIRTPTVRARAGHAASNTSNSLAISHRVGGIRTPTSAVKSRVRCRYATTPVVGNRAAFIRHARLLRTSSLRPGAGRVTGIFSRLTCGG